MEFFYNYNWLSFYLFANTMDTRILCNIKLSLLLAAITLWGCSNNKNPYFEGEYEVISAPGQARRLSGECIIAADTAINLGGIYYVGDRLLGITYDNLDHFFIVYNSNGLKTGSFGTKGRARNEFTDGAVVTQQTDGNKIWINDVNKAMLHRVDINASLDSSICIVDKVVPTAGRVINAFYMNDTTIIYEQETMDNYKLYRYNTDKQEIIEQYDLYTPNSQPFMAYRSFMMVHPDGNKIVSAMHTLNQVNFITIDNKDRKSVSLYEIASLEEDYSRKKMFYTSITSTRNRIYALYLNESMTEDFRKPKPVEVHIFDWNGNLTETLVLNEHIRQITIDDKGKFIIGMDFDHNVYKYNL